MYMEGIEMTCFQIISSVGMARASFIEAIDYAIDGKFDQAEDKIKEGEEYFVEGHKAHAGMIQKEIVLLLLHAEDQLMSAESFKILADKFIRLSKKISHSKGVQDYE